MIIPENKFLLDPILKEQSLTMIYAARGTGKTMFSLNLANAVATGTDFLMWKAKNPSEVIYIDGEMQKRELQDRIKLINKSGKLV